MTRTPLRLALGGGATDLPSYANRHGGFVVGLALAQYIYLGVTRSFSREYVIRYSQTERVRTAEEIVNPIVRAILQRYDPGPVELVSMADVPAGTGLGSSGAFTVGLLRLMHAWHEQHRTVDQIAREACEIELEVLARHVGKQDQYIAAYGGQHCYAFGPGPEVRVTPLRLSTATEEALRTHLLLFYTGLEHDAAQLLEDQYWRCHAADGRILANLDAGRKLAWSVADALEQEKPERLPDLLNAQWALKRQRSPGITTDTLDRIYDYARDHGALGGRLLGAGGGGFFLFYTDEAERLRHALGQIRTCDLAGHRDAPPEHAVVTGHLREIPFGLARDGAMVFVRD